MISSELKARLAEIAGRNKGFVTAAQAEAVGITQAQLDQAVAEEEIFTGFGGLQEPSFPAGIYRHCLHDPLGLPRDWLSVTLLNVDPATPAVDRAVPQSGVVSHLTAAEFHRIWSNSDFQFTFPPGCVDSAAAAAKQLTIVTNGALISEVMVYIKPICAEECEYMHGVPVTNLIRTFNDVILDRTLNSEDVGNMVVMALNRNLIDKQLLTQAISRVGSEKFRVPDADVMPLLLEHARMVPAREGIYE